MKRSKFIAGGLFILLLFSLGLLWLTWSIGDRLAQENKEKDRKIQELRDSLDRSILFEPDFVYLSPKDGLMAALEYYDVKNPKIVYAQAVLETGGFKSRQCVYDGNLFGLYDSSSSKYYKFSHWTESVKAYRDKVQYRYREDRENYYDFLDRIGYASDSLYTHKLKNIVNNPSLVH